MTVVVSCVRSGPSHCTLLLGVTGGAAELLWPGALVLGASATSAAHTGQTVDARCWMQSQTVGRGLPLAKTSLLATLKVCCCSLKSLLHPLKSVSF